MSLDDRSEVDRRRFLKYAGVSAAAAAGCTTQETSPTDDAGQEGTPTPTQTATEGPSGPETREEYLQEANRLLNERAPWIYLNRQFSVYGRSTDIEWEARRDELIDASEITPTGDDASVTLTYGQMDSGLDPHDHRETPTDNVVTQCYDGVLDRDAEGRIVESLATGYERLEEGRVRFELRDDVTFHNGDEFQASDVAFSVNRIVDPDVGDLESPQNDQLAGVTGAEAVDGGVEVTSDGLNPIVFQEFATYCDVVQEEWIGERDSPEINSDMNGTGPFELVGYEADVRVEYEAFGDHWGGEPDVEELTINAAEEASTRVSRLLADESDVVVNVPPEEVQRIQGDDATEVEAVPSTRVIFNAMRYDVEPFSSQAFRQAMNYAVDLESIIENVLAGFAGATGQPTLEGFVGYNPEVDPYPYDPDRAEDLVEESGHAGVELTLHTPVGRYLKDVEIAQAVVGFVDDLENVSCSVEQRDFQALVDELLTGDIEDKPHFYLIGWGNATFDASQTIIPLLTTGGAMTTYEDEEVDELIGQAQSLPGEE